MTLPAPTGFAAALTLAASMACGAALAGEPGSLTYEGFIELERLSGEIDETALIGDVWLRYTSPTGFGFDAGLLGVTDFDDSEIAVFGALTYSFGSSKISIGVPRPAYNAFGSFPAIGGSQVLKLGLGAAFNGGLAEHVYLLGDTDAPIGIRYDGDYGRLNVAASYLRFDDLDADDIALALSFDVNSNIKLLGDWEQFDPAGAPSVVLSRVGAELNYGTLSGGLTYFNRDFNGGAPHIDGNEIWMTYRASEAISVTGSALNTNVFDLMGLSLRYERPLGDSLGRGFYGQIGVVDGRNTDTTIDVSVGLQF